MDQSELDEDRELVARAGTFSVQLVTRRYSENGRLRAHDKVLRPLLKAATECWAYDIKPASDVYRIAKEILVREKRRYQVCLDGDPIRGRELFWNAQGGKRGTIVLLVPRSDFDAEAIFRGGHEAFVFTNFRAGHTPAAIRFAREQVESSETIAVCLPRNNGIQWMDIYPGPEHAPALFDIALRTCGAK